MRLLNIRSLEFREFAFFELPPYAIASHRWSKSETTYKRFQGKEDVYSPGRRKVEDFCRVVWEMNRKVIDSPAWTSLGFRLSCDWLWIDTACIDKTDSVELSEAINSMFRWYRGAAVCYAYLPDIRSIRDYQGAMLDFMQSEWFARGWTLQELLSPGVVVFFTKDWEVLGHKCGHDKPLCNVICRGFGQRLDFILSRITKIPLDVIRDYSHASDRDIKEKMSWLRGRKTTRPEDRAYCLLGICDVFLSPIYGEGEDAWRRLQNLIEEKEREKQAPKPLDVLFEFEDITHSYPTGPVEEVPSFALYRQFGTQGEARARRDVLWTATKEVLYCTPRARTDAGQRRLLQSSMFDRSAPWSPRPEPLLLAPSDCSVPFSPTSLGPKIDEQIVVEPHELGQWLLPHRVPSENSKETCGYCHGTIYARHPTARCQTASCETIFHRRCAGQRCQRCEPAPKSVLTNIPDSTMWMLPEEEPVPSETDAPPEELPSQPTSTEGNQAAQPFATPSTNEPHPPASLETLPPLTATDLLSSKDAASIEALVSEIVARRLALDAKQILGTDMAIDRIRSDGSPSRAIDQSTPTIRPLARQLTTTLKRRLTSGYWRERGFGRLGRRKTLMVVGEEPGARAGNGVEALNENPARGELARKDPEVIAC